MPRTYRPYEYDYDTPYIGRTEVIESYLDKKLSNVSVDTNLIRNTIKCSVHESLSDVDCQFCSVHKHIDRAKDEIINHEPGGCMCHLATKEDIANAVEQINTHTDEKFQEVDFELQFMNLNEQLARLNH